MKPLAILALLLAVVCPPPVPGQASNHGSEASDKPRDQAASGKTPNKPTITLIEKNCESEQFKNDPDCKKAENKENAVSVSKLPTVNVSIQSNPKRDFPDWVSFSVSFALAIAGFGGVGVGVFTVLYVKRQTFELAYQRLLMRRSLRAIRQQADLMADQTRILQDSVAAAQESARAALKTVQIMIDSERPWVIAHMEQSKRSCLLDNGNVRFTWTVKNVGKSPAKLIEAGAMVSLDTMGPAINQIQYKMESLDERILVPGDSAPLFVFWSIVEDGRIRTQLGKTLEEFNDLAMVYGCIRYRSAINTPDIYETRFTETSSISGGICDGFETSWPSDPEDIRCT